MEAVWYALYAPGDAYIKIAERLKEEKAEWIMEVFLPNRKRVSISEWGDIREEVENLFPGYVFVKTLRTGLEMIPEAYQYLKRFTSLGLRRILHLAYITNDEMHRVIENTRIEIEVQAGPDPKLALETEKDLFTLPETLLAKLYELIRRKKENVVRFMVKEKFDKTHIFLLSFKKLLHVLNGTKLWSLLSSLTGT